VGASESDPKFTLAPCATFSASITRSTGVVPPAGASRGESKSNCGTPVTLPDCGVTAKATALETSEPFATETVIVLAVATSCAGTETVRTSHFPAPAQFPGVTEPGVSAALPKFTCELLCNPPPVIVSLKPALPARVLVGEMAEMLGWIGRGGHAVLAGQAHPVVSGQAENLKPQPKSGRREPNTMQRRIAPLRMVHH